MNTECKVSKIRLLMNSEIQTDQVKINRYILHDLNYISPSLIANTHV